MLETALQSWRAIVGVDRVLSDSRDLRPYECATSPWASRCLAVVRPEHARQVQACHRSANEVGVPLLPVSRGRGWGLSGWLQDRDAVVLDLSDLDRILDLDLKTGTARVEPGVTFAALQEALATAGLSYHLPSFGGA